MTKQTEHILKLIILDLALILIAMVIHKFKTGG